MINGGFPKFPELLLFLAIFLVGMVTADFLERLKYYDSSMFWLYIVLMIINTMLIKVVYEYNKLERRKK